MKISQIENWALSVIERVENRQPIEDSRVELKSNWPDPQKAARRIAGHANSSRGEPILWLIGIDEDKGVIKIDKNELSTWYSSVKSHFCEVIPELTDIILQYGDKSVVALYFETIRAPYIVKNPSYGQPHSGPVELEVPWRESTCIRSARRADLLKILIPFQKIPIIEILNGSIGINRQQPPYSNRDELSLELIIYFVPKTNENIIIPVHKCNSDIKFQDYTQSINLDHIIFSPYTSFVRSSHIQSNRPVTATVITTDSELILEGPGKVKLNASKKFEHLENIGNTAIAYIKLGLAGSDQTIKIECQYERNKTDEVFKQKKVFISTF